MSNAIAFPEVGLVLATNFICSQFEPLLIIIAERKQMCVYLYTDFLTVYVSYNIKSTLQNLCPISHVIIIYP